MFTFWSEIPSQRRRELAADVSTWIWVAFWAVVSYRIHQTIAGFAEAGHALQQGGLALQDAGGQVGGSLDGIPVVGTGAGELARRAFGTAGEPFVFVGGELFDLVILVARLLAILVLAVAIVPWLSRYLPWRAARLAQLRAADAAIRRRPTGADAGSINHLLASRAIHRLSWEELLAESRDPVGDFLAGRDKALARAELRSVGLRPR